MLDTRDFCRYLRSVRDGDLTLVSSWVKRYDFGDEPSHVLAEFWLDHPVEQLTENDVVLALATAAKDEFATDVIIFGEIQEDTDPEVVEDQVVVILATLGFNAIDLVCGFYEDLGDGVFAVAISLFTEHEKYLVGTYNDGEILVSG